MSTLTFPLKEIIAIRLPAIPRVQATISFDELTQLTKKMYKRSFIYHFLQILKAPVE